MTRDRTCVDLVGARRYAHRVLLEFDGATPVELEPAGAHAVVPDDTAPANMLRPLTREQIAALHAIFGAQHYAWPPLPQPVAATVTSAARRINVDASALKDRLKRARERVGPYGFGSCRLTDPEYVYALVDIGLIRYPGTAPATVR